MTETSIAAATWERWWAWESIVSMVRLEPGTWVPIGAGSLDDDLEREITARVGAADHRADAAAYEVRSLDRGLEPDQVEARVTPR